MSNVKKSIRSNVKNNKVECQMSKITKVNFDGAYLRSSSGHFQNRIMNNKANFEPSAEKCGSNICV